MLDSVRTRLTLWYVGALTVVLLAFSLGVYTILKVNLERRTDAGLQAALDSMRHLLAYERAEGDSEQEAARNTVAELRYPNMALAVFTKDGKLLAETTAAPDIHAELTRPPDQVTETLTFMTLPDAQNPDVDGSRVAQQRVRALPTDPQNLIVARQSLLTTQQDLGSLRRAFAVAIPLALVLAGLGGWLLARKALAPVVSMSEHARSIGAHNLDDRLPVANPRDELGRLAETFNQLLARLNVAFEQQRQFMADASHELRTPLSVMHTTAQVTLEKPKRDDKEYRDAITLMDAQVHRLARIVADMFTLARADSGHRPLQPTDFYLDELVGETVRAAKVLGERRGVNVELGENREIPYRGDEGLLRQMLLNLLDNAIKFTPTGGNVSVELMQRDGRVECTVADTGPGIPREAQPHVFERFYRVDAARSRVASSHSSANGSGSGAGLGLSIALWIAQAHAGTVNLVNSDSSGTTFSVQLPLTPL